MMMARTDGDITSLLVTKTLYLLHKVTPSTQMSYSNRHQAWFLQVVSNLFVAKIAQRLAARARDTTRLYFFGSQLL